MGRFKAVGIGLSAALLGAAGAVSAQGLAQPTAERFVLSGVILLDGERGWAWLEEPKLTGNQVVAVRTGGAIGPYRLTRVFDDRVELDGPSGKVLIPLYSPSGRGAASTAVASAASDPSRSVPTPLPETAPTGQPAVPSVASPTPPAWRSRDPERRKTQGAAAAKQGEEEARATADGRAEKVANVPSSNPNALAIPIGDPRRRDALHTLFGGR